MELPKMETERLIIRPVTFSDLEDICEYGTKEENGRYMIYWPKSKEEITEFLQKSVNEMNQIKPRWFEFAIELKVNHKVIGHISLNRYLSAMEIGWISNKAYWNHGYMSEAAQRVIKMLLTELDFHKIYATCSEQNIASYRVMEHCGMKRINKEEHCKAVKQGVDIEYTKLTYCITSR